MDGKKFRCNYLSDGDAIPHVDQSDWNSTKTGAWCYYNNDESTNSTYGKLYNWYAVNDPRGLAPAGFHVASDNEWSALVNNQGGFSSAGGPLKKMALLIGVRKYKRY